MIVILSLFLTISVFQGSHGFAKTPSEIGIPAYVVNAPFSYSTRNPNNIWMTKLSEAERQTNMTAAFMGFLDLFRELSSKGLVYILPTPKDCKLQDLVYVANLGIVLSHLPNTVIISNYTSPPRVHEAEVGYKYFKLLGYNVHISPFKFEGEADLKHLHDNVYIGGYGMRSQFETFLWMEENFGMKIIKVQLKNPYLYHLDCSIFPITRGYTLVGDNQFTKNEIRELRKYTNIVPASEDMITDNSVCNSVRVGNTIISDISTIPNSGKEEFMYRLSRRFGLKFKLINISEFEKSGAELSCMVMHLNRVSYTPLYNQRQLIEPSCPEFIKPFKPEAKC